MLKWKQSVEEKRFHKTKETTVQGRFLGSVFKDVLGYKTLENATEWNQIAEHKSMLDSTQADGALGFFSTDLTIVRAMIESKDANANFDKKQHRNNHLTPVEQAFYYANKTDRVADGSLSPTLLKSDYIKVLAR